MPPAQRKLDARVRGHERDLARTMDLSRFTL